MTVLNVLLMLSTEKPPDPMKDVAWHIQRSRSHGVTYLATPQALRTLSRDSSSVVIYGNEALDNRVLAIGRFLERVETKSKRGIQIATEQAELYVKGTLEGAKTWIGMDHLTAAPAGMTLATLQGTIVSDTGERDGILLDLGNLGLNQARGCVYFTTGNALPLPGV